MVNRPSSGKKFKVKHKKGGGTLSFAMDDEEEEEDCSSLPPPPPAEKKRKLGKNPTVDTSFLPDRDREVSTVHHVTCSCSSDWVERVSCSVGS